MYLEVQDTCIPPRTGAYKPNCHIRGLRGVRNWVINVDKTGAKIHEPKSRV